MLNRLGSAAAAIFFASATPAAAIDLSRASVERLDNGLTLIMLEDRTFPVVSIQTVYRTGAKDDPAGRLGLAHFFEHMAFRGSKNFPDTGLVSAIYAVGGEWHGYTWIDLTTYFATTPKEHLDLLLDIEADRMARLDLKPDEIEAERGAVFAEMNGYANDPDSTLFDALIAAHFLTHPYRNNTIGYSADVSAIRFDDIAGFYERHYAPQNAVIALVGDFDRNEVRKAVAKRFGAIRKRVAPRDPLTAELPRTGERRVRNSLPSEYNLFKIAYPAPAASHADFPAFLVLQALIGESSGVNFNQNDWGTRVGDASPIAGTADDLRSWIIPTAEPYAFVLSGSSSPKTGEAKIERRIQKVFDSLAQEGVSDARLAAAIEKVHAALAFDVDTTEEAAHQLAYFAGIGAFEQLLTLEENVAAVTAESVRSVAAKYLRADQRTIAWLTPGEALPNIALVGSVAPPMRREGAPGVSGRANEALSVGEVGWPPLLFRRSELSNTVTIKSLLAGRYQCDACAADEAEFEATTVSASSTSEKFAEAFEAIAGMVGAARLAEAKEQSSDPLTRLEEYFAAIATLSPEDERVQSEPYVKAIAVSGMSDAASAKDALLSSIPKRRGGVIVNFSATSPPFPDEDVVIRIDRPLTQEAVGFIAVMRDPLHALATQVALYVLSHGYEGRLGKEAITRRGLLYYIDANFRPWFGAGVVTLAAGVDPEKVEAFRSLMKSEIKRLQTEPPTDAEIAEAKRHLLGRKISAAQSNEEIADALIRDFLAVGGPESAEAFAARLDKVTREDVMKAVDALQKGAVVTVQGDGVD
jgi:zinc protease